MSGQFVNARRDAILIAVLFIISTTGSIAGMLMSAPATTGPDVLAKVVAGQDGLRLSLMVLLVAALVIPAMAILFYPYFRRSSSALALGYVVIRSGEAVFYCLGILLGFGLIGLALAGTGPQAGDVSPVLSMLMDMQEATYALGTMLVFGIGAVVLGVLLYATRLVPRWLSVWAVIGGVLVTIEGALELMAVSNEILSGTMFLPIAVNEMVFAVWLIVVGFDRKALDRLGGNAS